jgi:hypothetical protein
LLTVGAPFGAAQSAGDWAPVLQIKSGKRITVQTTAAARKSHGRLHTATAQDITLLGKNGTRQTFARTDVTLVRLRRSNAWPFAGAAAAAVVPAAVLASAEDHRFNRQIGAIAYPVFIAGGALIGKVVQRSARKTVYDVRP